MIQFHMSSFYLMKCLTHAFFISWSYMIANNKLVHVPIGKNGLNGAQWMQAEQAVPVAYPMSQEVHERLWYVGPFSSWQNMLAL